MEALDFSPDDKLIAVGSETGARILRLPEGKPEAELESAAPPSVVRFDPSSHLLALASSKSLKVGLYDVPSANLIKMLHSASPPTHLAWHPHEQLLAGAGEDRRIRIW